MCYNLGSQTRDPSKMRLCYDFRQICIIAVQIWCISRVRSRFPHTGQQVSEICGYLHPKHDMRGCAPLIFGHHKYCNIMWILQWCRIIYVASHVLSWQMKAFCVHCKCWEFLWVAVCQISIIIASNAHQLLRVDDSNDFMIFVEIQTYL